MTQNELENVKKSFDNGEAILLDVREFDEWKESHVVGSRLLPLSQITEGNIPDDLPTNKIIYTFCRRGTRAQEAAWLLGSDFENVTALCFDYSQFENSGFLIETSETAQTPN